MPEPGEALSDREMEVLQLVTTGATNQQIALDLDISENTVKTHLRNIYIKLEVSSRTEATLRAVREGWVILDLTSDEEEEPAATEEEALAETEEEAEKEEETGETVATRPALPQWTRWVALVSIILLMVVSAVVFTDLPDRLLSPTPDTTGASNLSPTPVERWSIHPEMPTPRSNLALVAFEALLYAIGGDSPAGVSDAVERYDAMNGAWAPLASKPTAVADVQGAALAGRIYVPGGRDASGEPTTVNEVYEVERNRWLEAAPLPRPLSAYALVAYEGRVYLFGGWDGTTFRDEILRYDPIDDSWEEVGQLPFSWGHAGAVVANNRILLLGGVNADGPIDVLLDYSPSFGPRDTIPLPDISLGRSRATALTGDYLYILAEPQPENAELWQFSIRTGRWLQIAPSTAGIMPQAAIAGIGSEIFLVGGENGEEPLAVTQAYLALFIIPIELPGTTP